MSSRKGIQESLSWIEPYLGRQNRGLNGLIAEICECHELRLLAKYHFLGSRRDFRNALLRDCFIPVDSPQSDYLGKRWERFYGKDVRDGALEFHELVKRDGQHCQYCLRENCALEIHHVIPREKKGPDSASNLVLACPKCNKRISSTISIPRNWWRLHPESVFCDGEHDAGAECVPLQLPTEP